ncbi:MAG: outer membrane protein assembly factor BamD [Flavobacteriaceae bacterium]|nr:outer membrane protein assembly factor BamD [Flavobacteriaceae bacterium]
MLKIQRILLVVAAVLLLVSCSEYQEVLNKGTAEDQYKAATKLFEEGKYSKAIALFEKVIPSYGRRPQMERIQYMVAMSNYKTKSYELAAYYFNRFISNYPNSSKIEEATFLTAHSYYLDTPKYSRDQKDTQTALQSLQNFIDKYPSSDKIEEANKYFRDLTFRLERKSFEVAKQYYHIEDYKAAIVAFDNFVSEHVGSSLKEEALYYRFKASNDLAVNSILIKKEKRLEDAIAAHAKFKKNFPESKRTKELDRILASLNKQLDETKELIQKLKENTVTSNGL